MEGFEPSTSDLKSNILPSKLHRTGIFINFRMVGIEPTSIDPKSTMLPLHHIQANLVRIGIEPIASD